MQRGRPVRKRADRREVFVKKKLFSRFALNADETSAPSKMRLPNSETASAPKLDLRVQTNSLR